MWLSFDAETYFSRDSPLPKVSGFYRGMSLRCSWDSQWAPQITPVVMTHGIISNPSLEMLSMSISVTVWSINASRPKSPHEKQGREMYKWEPKQKTCERNITESFEPTIWQDLTAKREVFEEGGVILNVVLWKIYKVILSSGLNVTPRPLSLAEWNSFYMVSSYRPNCSNSPTPFSFINEIWSWR